MERKTKVDAENGRHDLTITREFDLPVNLLFKAYVEPGIIEQWMNTTVLKLESKQHGSYRIETKTPDGKVAFRANGAIHQFSPNQRIVRTFEMEGMPFGIQLEFYEFEALTDDTSKLTMHVIYESNDKRDQVLKLPFAQGINMAHNRLQQILSEL
ncbi:SRPBCC family protein [Mucilaginibacter antarcticus]|uniref:SRPBCC domain-containing protein n=1 Tax=Mucilaginibacter antarcticus TaxID=1855725 RepID=A0ABW5XLZ4_9SPHI